MVRSRFCHFVGLRIEGKSAEETESGRVGGELGSSAVVVAEVLPVGYLPPPGKGKGKISEIMYSILWLRIFEGCHEVHGHRGP